MNNNLYNEYCVALYQDGNLYPLKDFGFQGRNTYAVWNSNQCFRFYEGVPSEVFENCTLVDSGDNWVKHLIDVYVDHQDSFLRLTFSKASSVVDILTRGGRRVNYDIKVLGVPGSYPMENIW